MGHCPRNMTYFADPEGAELELAEDEDEPPLEDEEDDEDGVDEEDEDDADESALARSL